MKIIGISCGRKNGNNETALKEALFEARSLGAEIEIIALRDLNIEQCKGCEACMRSLVSGGNGDCVIKDDDYTWMLDKIMEADGFILSAPVYDLIPCGRLITVLNRGIGMGISRRIAARKNPKISAAICIGGSDWTNLAFPLIRLSLTNLSKDTIIVDQIVRNYYTAPAMVLLDDEMMERARLVGRHVVEGIKNPDMTGYYGDKGICPVCNSNLLEPIGGDRVICAFCKMNAKVEIKDGKLSIEPDRESVNHQRFSLTGEKDHQDDIRRCNKKAADEKAVIQERLAKYSDDSIYLHR